MNYRTKDIMIKILLTIPALIIGVISAVMFILKPTIDLWKNEKPQTPILPEITPVPPHEFH